jgi:NADPH:quinone reductase-like Zn-dependent oxidoreductase
LSLSAQCILRPQPGPHQALVRVAVAAHNPTDVLCFDAGVFGEDSVLGCDFAGTVTAVGSQVTRIRPGDKIAGLIWGGKFPFHHDSKTKLIIVCAGQIKGQGAYSEYTIADEKICFAVPLNVPLEHAAIVPLAATTAWLALFRSGSLAID